MKPSCTKGEEDVTGRERGREGSRQDTGTVRLGREQTSPRLPCYPTHRTRGASRTTICCPAVTGPSGYSGFPNTLLFSRDSSWGASVTTAGNYKQPLLKSVCQQLHFKS